MKPQQLSHLLNVAPTTLRRWAREYGEFLSPAGRGNDGAYRTYNDRDSRIMGWIATMRAQNIPPDEIVVTLRAAQSEGWRSLPPLPNGLDSGEPVSMIPREAAEERLRAIEERHELQVQALTKERDELRAQLAESRAENAELRKQQFEINQRLLSLNDRLASLLEKEQRRRK